MLAADTMMTPAEIAIARERGRLKAYEALLSNPLKRARMEAKWGLERMRKRWPELYTEVPPAPQALLTEFYQRNFGAYGRA